MATTEINQKSDSYSNGRIPAMTTVTMRKAFYEWLNEGNAKRYSVNHILASIDKYSAYAVRKKISVSGFWEYQEHDLFRPVYNKMLGLILLRIIDKNTYRVFIVAGQLYMRFLRDMSQKQMSPFLAEEDDKPVSLPKHLIKPPIASESVIAWLLTQPNANGTLYLEGVVRQYMRLLRSTPIKFDITIDLEKRNVFECQTSGELITLWDIFKTATNYRQVNMDTSGMFSAGMGCLMRYLTHLEKQGETSTENMIETKGLFLLGIDEEISNVLDAVLVEKFSNGFRYTSKIEIGRLRKFAGNLLNRDVSLPDDDILNYIKSQGTEHDGKIYIVKTETIDHIYDLANAYFDSGAIAIFYSEFYSKNEPWLFESSVISEEMLKKILQTRFAKLYFTHTYFGKTNESVYNVLRSEVGRVWSDDVLITYEKLARRLSYVPQSRIEQFLGSSNSGDYIWNSVGEYTHISKIAISECEIKQIADFVETEICAHSYASLADVPLDEIAEHNHELSRTAIQTGVFQICLSEKYDRRGKIITRKGYSVDAISIMREYCRSVESCTLDDLLAFEKELTGEQHRWIPMQAGYDVLIRTGRNSFIAEKYVNFDVSTADGAIEHFLHGGEYVPLKAVVTFAMFPPCGQTWNLFLLESYCWRFSEMFRFESLAVNSKNAGVIIRKNSKLSYLDIMADAVEKANVVLKENAVMQFLFENGYVGKRKYKKINEVIKQAATLRA